MIPSMLRLLHRKLQAHSFPLPFHSPPLLSSPITRFLSSSSPSSADANSAIVLTTFRSHGVPDDLCETLLSKQAKLRTMKPEKALNPKLAFLRSEGFSGPEMAEILLGNPFFLEWSLDRSLSPSVTFLRSILPSKDALLRVLSSINKPFTPKFVANINVLKNHDLSEAMFLKLLLSRPRTLTCDPGDFIYALEYLKKLNISPTTPTFVTALNVLSCMSRSTFQRKLEMYKELGWTEEGVLKMFKVQPITLAKSDEAIWKKVICFRETMGLSPDFLFTYPVIMTMSLEKRILPWCTVLNLLMSTGLLKRNTSPGYMFTMGERIFVEKFVKKYEETSPGVLRAYEGKTKASHVRTALQAPPPSDLASPPHGQSPFLRHPRKAR